VKIDPAIQNTTNGYTNLNIKLPNAISIPSFKVIIQNTSGNTFWSQSNFTITLAYQAGDPCANGGYFPIAADFPTIFDEPSTDKPRISFTYQNAIEINFVANLIGTRTSGAVWSRLSLDGEGAYNYFNNGGASIGAIISIGGSSVALTSGVVASSSTLNLTAGMWLITGHVEFTVSSTLIATDLIAGVNLVSSTTVPTASNLNSTARMTANLPSAGTFVLAMPPNVFRTDYGNVTTARYGNARATFSAGTVSARVMQRAIRIG
jgi:hypothetical protein